jgi:hypothetical protein
MTEIYDKADYHSGGNWPDGLPVEQSFVHSGLFLGWLIQRGLVSEEVDDATVRDFKRHRRTGPEIFRDLDGVLDASMLTADGRRFAKAYFDFGTGAYVSEYTGLLASGLASVYAVPDTWENYERLRAVLDRRFQQWCEGRLEQALAADGYPSHDTSEIGGGRGDGLEDDDEPDA